MAMASAIVMALMPASNSSNLKSFMYCRTREEVDAISTASPIVICFIASLILLKEAPISTVTFPSASVIVSSQSLRYFNTGEASSPISTALDIFISFTAPSNSPILTGLPPSPPEAKYFIISEELSSTSKTSVI